MHYDIFCMRILISTTLISQKEQLQLKYWLLSSQPLHERELPSGHVLQLLVHKLALNFKILKLSLLLFLVLSAQPARKVGQPTFQAGGSPSSSNILFSVFVTKMLVSNAFFLLSLAVESI